MNEMKKKLSMKNKEINDLRKKINSIEAKLLDVKLERHAILKNSKIELIELPMLRGVMEDISDEDVLPTQPQTQRTNDPSFAPSESSEGQAHTESLNTISTNDQTVLFEKESRIKIDYKKLDTDYLNVKLIVYFS
jgi:structural maintenance of chromosome 1